MFYNGCIDRLCNRSLYNNPQMLISTKNLKNIFRNAGMRSGKPKKFAETQKLFRQRQRISKFE
jgi:hypothetical protein